MAGALTASFQNLDDTILIESDSYARSETYTQLETGAVITAAIDALDLSQLIPKRSGGRRSRPSSPRPWRRSGTRKKLPGRFQDHHGSGGFLHAGRSRSAAWI